MGYIRRYVRALFPALFFPLERDTRVESGRSCSPTLANAWPRKLRHGLALRRTNRNGPPGGGRSVLGGEDVITTSGSLLFIPCTSPRIPGPRLVVSFRPPASNDIRRPLNIVHPSLSYFTSNATLRGSTVERILRQHEQTGFLHARVDCLSEIQFAFFSRFYCGPIPNNIPAH